MLDEVDMLYDRLKADRERYLPKPGEIATVYFPDYDQYVETKVVSIDFGQEEISVVIANPVLNFPIRFTLEESYQNDKYTMTLMSFEHLICEITRGKKENE